MNVSSSSSAASFSIEEGPFNRQQVICLSLEQSNLVIDRMFSESPLLEKNRLARRFLEVINRGLQEDQTEFRLSKNGGLPSLWCRQEDGKIVITFIRDFLARGNHKKVKQALNVSFFNDGDSFPSFNSHIVARVPANDIDTVLEGVELHRKILENIPESEKYFVPYPHVFPIRTGVQGTEKLELETPLYHGGDLAKIIQDSFFITEEKCRRYVTPLELIRGLSNIALGIEQLAEKGMSYQDLKAENILLKLNEGDLLLHISDFDRTVENIPLLISDERESPFLNTLARLGVATKETDCYGLVLLIAETLILDFRALMYNEETINREAEKHREIIESPKEIMEELRELQMRTLKDLLPEAHALLEPFSDCMRKNSKKEIEDLLNYAKALERSLGPCPGSAVIRKFITGLCISREVMPLLARTLKADKISDEYECDDDELITEEGDPLLIPFLKALEAASFPTIQEIKEILSRCSVIAQNIQSF